MKVDEVMLRIFVVFHLEMLFFNDTSHAADILFLFPYRL